MPGDIVPGHQGQKVSGRVAAQGAAAEMRIFRKEVLWSRSSVGEIAAPAAGDQNLCTHLIVVVEKRHPFASRARCDGTHETCGTST